MAWREEGGRTLLYASHDMEEVARVADHVVLLSRGRIVGRGQAAAILGDGAALAGAGMRPPLAGARGGRYRRPWFAACDGPSLAAGLETGDVARDVRT